MPDDDDNELSAEARRRSMLLRLELRDDLSPEQKAHAAIRIKRGEELPEDLSTLH